MGNLYERIESLAKKNGYKNITEFCRAAEIPRATMSELKAGRTKRLSTDTMAKIALKLNVSVDCLMTGEHQTVVTAYSNGVYAYAGSTTQEIENKLAEREPASFRIVYRAPGVIVTVDNDSSATDDQINAVIAIYDPAYAEKAPSASDHDILDEVDIAFYGDYKELDEDDKETLRAMARVMRERRAKRNQEK